MKTDSIDRFVEEWSRSRPEADVRPQAGILRIIRIASGLERRLAQIARAHGLNIGQFNVLTALRRLDPTPLPPKQLMRATLFSSGALTPILDKLEQKQLVRRLADPHDRRGILAALTDRGRQAIDGALAERERENLALASVLSKEEQDTFSRLARKLLTALEEGRT